ncbi:MAG: DUF11 domain-containing protein [Pirellulales bacterium]|nr:DUF11 domain-containing protein [Pirellulales bacterium]
MALALAPPRSFAPVGTEVVLVAGVTGINGAFQTDRRIDWMLDAGGVGHIVGVDGADRFWMFKWGDRRPRKIDALSAVTVTSTSGVTLTRGTPLPSDDIIVYRGQSWISVSSPVEGTSYVTAYARDVYGWDVHHQSATIEWVDALWAFPPPAANPVGTRHVFTTTVTRQSTGSPIQGWRVKYEIAGGPSAGFAPDGAPSIEVPTNDLGQGSAEIFQPQPASGTNQINVTIIRPPVDNGGSPVIIAAGTTSKSWSAPDISIQVTGPPQGAAGTPLSYRVEVANRGAIAARGATVISELPAGLTFVSSSPPLTPTDNRVQWSLGDLQPGESRALDLSLRADQAGSFNVCASVQTSDGLTAQNCATTAIMGAGVDVSMTGPQQAVVGQDVVFDILVSNRGATPLENLLLVDRFDAGLQHEVSASPIERPLGTLAVGQSVPVQVRFRVTQPGQLCHTVEVTGAGGVSGSARGCVTAVTSPAPGVPLPPPPPAGSTQPPPGQPSPAAPPGTTTPGTASAGQARVQITKTGPTQRPAGGVAEFVIVVTNSGPVPLTDVKIVDNYDPSLVPTMATAGRELVGQDLVWRIPQLGPGEARKLEVHCRCDQPVAQACNRVIVTAAEGVRADAQACLSVGAAQSGATVSIVDLNDPVAINQELQYDVQVTNPGQTPDQDVVLTIDLPSQLTPVTIGTGGPTGYRIEGRIVRFQPLPQLAPGEVRNFRLRVRAVQPGAVEVRATVSSRLVPQGTSVSEQTTIQP